jgi:hypothetical protein
MCDMYLDQMVYPKGLKPWLNPLCRHTLGQFSCSKKEQGKKEKTTNKIPKTTHQSACKGKGTLRRNIERYTKAQSLNIPKKQMFTIIGEDMSNSCQVDWDCPQLMQKLVTQCSSRPICVQLMQKNTRI